LTSTPFSHLTPEVVLDALDSVGLRGDGRLIQLNSYENRVFQIFLEDGSVVVAKFYRPARWSQAQILEEHAFATELLAKEIPVVAPKFLQKPNEPHTRSTLQTFDVAGQRYCFSVSPRQSGRAPELDQLDTLEWLGRFIGRMHAVGQQHPFAHRLSLNLTTYGHAPRNELIASDEAIPLDALSTWREAVDAALAQVAQCFELVGPYRSIRLHGDCHGGNVLWTDAGPHFVDLDDALMGPAIQDLWMLLPGEAMARPAPLSALLRGYEAFMTFDPRELHLIEALRTLRMIHYSAWLAKRWHDPAFPIAFPWFGQRAYWNEQATRLHEQTQILLDQKQI
jgi:Ser/Thr protein kinase RdoA (MazF antagonist)